MRVLVQRVSRARVLVDGEVIGAIQHGLLLLVGVHADDDDDAVNFCAEKCAQLRIFADSEERMNRSVLETGGDILAISQFTLYGDCRRGRRPSFSSAAGPEPAQLLYEAFISRLESLGLEVARGVFGAHMEVEIVNDGPVTLLVESPAGAAS
jgi:D-tyrosyl-tRNA(Tyr) deacylase